MQETLKDPNETIRTIDFFNFACGNLDHSPRNQPNRLDACQF